MASRRAGAELASSGNQVGARDELRIMDRDLRPAVLPVGDAQTGEAVRGRVARGTHKPRQHKTGRPRARHTASQTCLIVIALCATFYVLHWARSLFVPLTMGVLLALTLNPLVITAQRLRIPRSVAAALIMLALWATGAALLHVLQDDFARVAQQAPQTIERIADGLRRTPEQGLGAVRGVREAVGAIERMVDDAASAISGRRSVRGGGPAVSDPSPLAHWGDYLWIGSTGIVALIGYLVVITFLAYFLLCSGESLKRRLVPLLGGGTQRKKAALRILDQIAIQTQYSLLVLLATNVVLSTATALAFWALGMDDPLMWGVVVMAVHIIPYVGSTLIAAAAGVAGFLQFGNLTQAFMPAIVFLVLATLVGNLFLTWLVSKAARVDAAVAFVGLLVFGWLWGVWGLLLGMPLLAVIKVICSNVESLRPVGEIMGGELSTIGRPRSSGTAH